MNYRHAYHAGNHGDVLKHIVLARVIEHLKKKEKGFLLLDAHAGTGAYALDGPEAGKTREWEGGVAKVFNLLSCEAGEEGGPKERSDLGGGEGESAREIDSPSSPPMPQGRHGSPLFSHEEWEKWIMPLLAPWRDAVRKINPANALLRYPGSPEIARQMLRPQDRMVFNELHPEDYATLAARYGGDRRVAVTALDAGVAVKTYLPPGERRGIALIDPAYEVPDEGGRVLAMLRDGLRRFATGVFLIWYPVVDDATAATLEAGVTALAGGKALLAEIRLRAVQPQGGLVGSGVIVVNPPYMLEEEIAAILPNLLGVLTSDAGARFRIAKIPGT
jgi:23S rRNA (adenine2030-N6)-methyltransferase